MANEIPIGGLQLEFTDNGSKSVAEDIKSLAEALVALRESSKGGSLTAKAKQINALAESIDKIKPSSVANLKSIATSITAISSVSPSANLANAISALGDSMDAIDTNKGKAFEQTADGIVDGVNKIKESTSGISTLSVQEGTEAFDQMGDSVNSASVAIETTKEKTSALARETRSINSAGVDNIGQAFRKLIAPIERGAQAINAFDKKIRAMAQNAISSNLGQLAKKFKDLGSAMFGAHSFAGKLLKSFVRIAFYRSIRFTLSSLVKGFKEGATNLYKWSDAFDRTRTFANSMDSIATSILYVKNSLGAMVAPIINAVAPAIEYLTDKFVGLINIVNEFISAFTGASTFTVAKRIGTKFEDIADSAGSASKAIHSFTIGIDELNIIEDTGSAGGGYGGAGGVAEDWFEKQNVSNEMQAFADKVKAITEKVGSYIEKLASIKSWDDLRGQIKQSTNELGFWNFGLVGIISNWDELVANFDKGVVDPLGNFGADRIEDLANAWDTLGTAVKMAWDDFKNDPLGFINTELEEMSKWLSPMPAYFEGFSNAKKWLEDPIEQFSTLGEIAMKVSAYFTPLPLIIEGLKTAFSNINKWLKDPIGQFEKLGGILLKISDYATPLPKVFDDWKKKLANIKKLVNDIKKSIEAIVNGDIDNLWSSIWGNDKSSGGGSSAEETATNVTNAFLNTTARLLVSGAGLTGQAIIKHWDNAGKLASSIVSTEGGKIGNAFVSSINAGIVSKQSQLKSTVSSLGRNSISEFTSSSNMALYKAGGQYLVSGIIQGLDSKKGNLYDSLNQVAKDAYSAFKKGAMIKSPSRLFAEGGMYIVLGLNEGIEKYAKTTADVVGDWLSSFSDIAPQIDMSNIAMPNVSAIAGNIQGAINANSDITTQAMTGDMAEFFTETLMPVIMDIASDAKRQADKSEVITLDGRKLNDGLTAQRKNNGYSFT